MLGAMVIEVKQWMLGITVVEVKPQILGTTVVEVKQQMLGVMVVGSEGSEVAEQMLVMVLWEETKKLNFTYIDYL